MTFDLVSGSRRKLTVVRLVLGVVRTDLYVEFFNELQILRIPCSLCSSILFWTIRLHRGDVKSLKDRIVITVVRGIRSNQIFGNKRLPRSDFFCADLLDFLINRQIQNFFLSGAAVICTMLVPEIGELIGREYHAVFRMSVVINTDLHRIGSCFGDDTFCRKCGILILHHRCRNANAALCLNACTAIRKSLRGRKIHVLAGV